MSGLQPTRLNGGEERAAACRVLVLGVGGGGCNSVARMAAGWTSGPETRLVNTDAQALAACGMPDRQLLVGCSLTRGMGTGGDPNLGRLALEEDADLVREALVGVDVLLLVVTFGGGTGSGAAPAIARLAREAGVTTIGLATLPFEFEGLRRRQLAAEGLDALRLHADMVVTIPNQHLLDLAGDQESLQDAFARTDAMLGVGVRSLWKLLTQPGIINLTLADLRNMVEHSSGSCTFGYAQGSGSKKAEQALARLMKSPLLGEGRLLASAQALLVNIVGGPDLALAEVTRVMNELTGRAQPDVRFFPGAAIEEDWKGKMAIVVLAAEAWDESPLSPRSAPSPDEILPGAAPVQPELPFSEEERGRFRGVDPTVVGGQDLDIPTYLRRGIRLSFER
ncbi:MAG TPA: cell division protein FtsZ [Kiritimatiellia bacterium]|nr:cell division protein FtsZ [Kiritimatiellia bacterium]HRZ11915.1 cell division protein FtsZ [Kiritimatiellia bacterium]HSA17279.1 cell division protein FtsZ [Kiritimatiellia bacterium]